MANAATSGRHCLACGRPLPIQNGPGRIRLYCDATCRSKARRTRQARLARKRKLDKRTLVKATLTACRQRCPKGTRPC